MQRAALSAALAALLGLVPASALAHLRASGASSLLGMLQTADGVLLARSVEATHARDPEHASTPFLARETIAGEAPSGGFLLDQEAPLLRYAGLADAIVLVKRDQRADGGARWLSVQPAGAGLVLEGPSVGDETRAVLRELFAAVHPPPGKEADSDLATAALVRALALPERKLRALALLDLAVLASDPQHFTALEVDRLLRYGDAPGDDAQLAPQVRDIGRTLAARRGARTPAAPAAEENQP